MKFLSGTAWEWDWFKVIAAVLAVVGVWTVTLCIIVEARDDGAWWLLLVGAVWTVVAVLWVQSWGVRR